MTGGGQREADAGVGGYRLTECVCADVQSVTQSSVWKEERTTKSC